MTKTQNHKKNKNTKDDNDKNTKENSDKNTKTFLKNMMTTKTQKHKI